MCRDLNANVGGGADIGGRECIYIVYIYIIIYADR